MLINYLDELLKVDRLVGRIITMLITVGKIITMLINSWMNHYNVDQQFESHLPGHVREHQPRLICANNNLLN